MSPQIPHMAETVLPRAPGLFRAWRPERFSPFGCNLCRGMEGDRRQLPHGLRPPAAVERRCTARYGVREISGHHPAEAGSPGADDERIPWPGQLQHYHPQRVWLLLLSLWSERTYVRALNTADIFPDTAFALLCSLYSLYCFPW